MAHVKGRAGLGAIDQIVNYRLTGDTKADIKPEGSWAVGLLAGMAASAVALVIAVIIALLFTGPDPDNAPRGLIFGITMIAGLCVGIPVARAPKLNPRNTRYYHAHNAVTQQVFAAKNNTSSDLSDTFAEREIPLVIGGLGEMRTEEKLNDLPDTYTVFHDIDCVGKGGHVSANIDHLVIGPNSAIGVDTKVWGKPLQPNTSIESSTFLPHDSPYWKAIGTCFYELSFLTEAPTCLIIAVGGKAGKALASDGPLNITDYVTELKNGARILTPCKIPVIIAAQTDVARVIIAHNDAAREYGITQPPFSVDEIENELKSGVRLRQDR